MKWDTFQRQIYGLSTLKAMCEICLARGCDPRKIQSVHLVSRFSNNFFKDKEEFKMGVKKWITTQTDYELSEYFFCLFW